MYTEANVEIKTLAHLFPLDKNFASNCAQSELTEYMLVVMSASSGCKVSGLWI